MGVIALSIDQWEWGMLLTYSARQWTSSLTKHIMSCMKSSGTGSRYSNPLRIPYVLHQQRMRTLRLRTDSRQPWTRWQAAWWMHSLARSAAASGEKSHSRRGICSSGSQTLTNSGDGKSRSSTNMLKSFETTLSNKWKHWFQKYTYSRTMNNADHRYTLQEFLDKVTEKTKDFEFKLVGHSYLIV